MDLTVRATANTTRRIVTIALLCAAASIALIASGCGDDKAATGATGINSPYAKAVTGTTGSTAKAGSEKPGEAGSGPRNTDSNSNNVGGTGSKSNSNTSSGSQSNDATLDGSGRLTTAGSKKVSELLGLALGASNKYIWDPYSHGRFSNDAELRSEYRAIGRKAADYVIDKARDAGGVVGRNPKYAALVSDLGLVVATYTGLKVSIKNELKGPGGVSARDSLNDAIKTAATLGIVVEEQVPPKSAL